MKFEDIKLPPGYSLQLQTGSASSQAKRINCRYLGALPGRYLLISPPRNTRLRSGQKLVVKIMIANGIAMFTATVESLIAVPEPMLCLSYPSSINMKEIRGATRVNVALEIIAENTSSLEQQKIEGRVADVSTTGAKLELTDVIGAVGDQLMIKGAVDIGGVARMIKLPAVIRARIDRSTKELDEKYPAVYGVEFGDLDDDNQLLLHAFVYGEMARE